MKYKQNLLLVPLLMLLTACECSLQTEQAWYPPPFKFSEQSVDWLKKAELQSKPPLQVIVDFDTFSKRELTIETNRTQ